MKRLILIISVLLAAQASATTIHVPADTATIQGGIDMAVNGDTVLVAIGTYVENINFNSHSIVVGSLFLTTGDTSYISQTIIDGNSSGPVITIASGEDSTTTICGFTIQNGNSSNGGGIYALNSSMIISNNNIQNNNSNRGGGLYASNSTLIVQRNTICKNNGGDAGGGLCFESCINVSVISNVIYQDTAQFGGGIWFYRSYGIIAYNQLFRNVAIDGVGGIYAYVIYPNSIIKNNTLAYNESTRYGALKIASASDIIVKNNIIAFNNDYGIYIESSSFIQVNFNDVWNNLLDNYYGILPGEGSISEDPQFLYPEYNDFSLMDNSHCIDTGDPSSPLDPDSTRADMGALYFDQRYRILNFHLIEPQTDSVYLSSPNQFIWNSTTDIDSGYTVFYKFFLDDNSFFDSPDSSGELSDTTYILPDTLDRSMQYYWRVLAYNYYATPIYSEEIWNFYIDGYPAIPEIAAPANGTIADSYTFLMWLVAADPDLIDTVTYTLQVDNDPSFNSPEIDVNGITNSGLTLEEAVAVRLGDLPGFSNLQQDQAYYWRVRSDDAFGLSSEFTDGSNYFIFGVNVNDPPEAPGSGFTPTGSEEISTDIPTISWNNATDPDPDDNASNLHYKLQLDSDSEFDTSYVYEYITAQGINQVEVTTPLTNVTQWYYRVQTIDDEALESSWSVIQNFWVRLYNLSPLPPESGFTPANGVEITELLPTISWNHATDPDEDDESSTLHYILQLDSDSEFDTTVTYEYSTPDGINYYTVDDSLSEDTYWLYRIRTVDDDGLVSVWSQVQSFWINHDNQSPSIPQGEYYPSNGQVVNTSYPELNWNPAIDPDPSDDEDHILYNIQVDSDGEFDTSVAYSYTTSLGQISFVISDSLANNIEWFYRLQAEDDGGLVSGWTPIQNFMVNVTNSPPNSVVDGFYPANSEEVISLTPLLTWNSATDPDPEDNAENLSYAIKLSQDSTFGGFVYGDTTDAGINQIQPTSELDDNSQYYYAILTIDDEGLSSDWSMTQNFWTNHYNYPPEPFPLISPLADIKRVDYYTYFNWGSTVDYDPMASYDFTLQYSPDSTFTGFVTSIEGLTDTTYTMLTDTLELAGQNLYWRVLAIDDDGLERIGGIPEEARKLTIIPAGDANTDLLVLGSDVIYLVGYFKGNISAPDPLLAGDANGDCQLIGSDITRLISYFKGYNPLVRGNCEQPVVLTKGRK